MVAFSVNSAHYAVRRDRWHDVNLEIYYQAGHEFDLDRMMLGMKSTLDYCTANFSPFQFKQVRIIEFPRYGNFAESFPNTIPFSEGIGFITYVDPNEQGRNQPAVFRDGSRSGPSVVGASGDEREHRGRDVCSSSRWRNTPR